MNKTYHSAFISNTLVSRLSKRTTLILMVSISSFLCMTSATKAENDSLSRGAEKVKAICAACHDASGISKSPDFPILAGQHKDYLREALNAYKRGDRKNPIMKAQVSSLSDQDIEDVAAYYSHQPTGLTTPKH